jgi:hypothetical protein
MVWGVQYAGWRCMACEESDEGRWCREEEEEGAAGVAAAHSRSHERPLCGMV